MNERRPNATAHLGLYTDHHSPSSSVDLFPKDNKIAYTYLVLCRRIAIEAIVQPFATTHTRPAEGPRIPVAEMKMPNNQSVMFRCHSMMVLGKPVSPWAAEPIPALRGGRVPLRAIPQAGGVKMGFGPRDSRAGGVCKQSSVYTQHPGSTGHVFRTPRRWLSAVGSRVASSQAIVARMRVRMPRLAAQ